MSSEPDDPDEIVRTITDENIRIEVKFSKGKLLEFVKELAVQAARHDLARETRELANRASNSGARKARKRLKKPGPTED
jgi:hypothetical protein